jgi:hypothetical protein
MSAVTNELQTVAKNLTVSTGKNNSYKAVSERDIIDAVKPLEIKHGIYSYPHDRQIIESQTLESESEYNGNVTKKTTFFSRIKTTYRFVNIEKPDEYIDMYTFAEGIDPQDKGSGKAMTYADKYALMKAYKISTGDDPDQNASEETHYNNVRAGKTEQTNQKELTPRKMLIARLNELNIDVNAYAKANNLSGKTEPEVFLKLLKELENA